MSLDRTLKTRGGLSKSRSVLSRPERIARLIDEEKLDPDGDSPFGLPKVKVRHSRAGTKSKKAEETTAEVADQAEDAETADAGEKKD